jgi:hypothetical protein
MKYLGVVCLFLTLCCCEKRAKALLETQESMQRETLDDEYKLAEVITEMANVSAKSPLQRKLIKHGILTFETSDLTKAKAMVQNLCMQYKGYLGSENQHNFENRLQTDQEIRVPAENFDRLMQELESFAGKIESKSTNAEDVTEQFIDVEARLKTKKELEARYRELLAMAKNVNEMISIESQIGNVRSEIESMEGQLNHMKNQISFSTIKLSYFEIKGTDFGFASKFAYSFKNGWNNLLDFLIVIIQVWPFLIGISLLTWFVSRWRKKRAMVA